jgi:hypothetical protein
MSNGSTSSMLRMKALTDKMRLPNPILSGDNAGDETGKYTVRKFTKEDLEGSEVLPGSGSSAVVTPSVQKFIDYVNTGDESIFKGNKNALGKPSSVRRAFINDPKNRVPVFKKDDPNNPALNEPKSTLYRSSQ